MALNDIKTYNYKSTFLLRVIEFDNACVIHESDLIDTYNIYWIKEGKGTYLVDFKSYTFNNNTLLFLSPGQVFSVQSEKINQAYVLSFVSDFYCIETHDKEIACNGVLFNAVNDNPFVSANEKDALKLDLVINQLMDEFKNQEKAQHDMLQLYLKQFIIHSVRIKNDVEYKINEDSSVLIKNFNVILEQNFKTTHSVSVYAERLGVSPKTLSKHFQNKKSLSPSALIKNRLILEAKRQLIYSDNSVKQVAFSLGFNDSAYFTRFFKKLVHKSPLQFKKDYKNSF